MVETHGIVLALKSHNGSHPGFLPSLVNLSRSQKIEMTMLHKESQIVLDDVIGRRLLNVREAAQYLGLEVDTVYKKARLREVPSVKVGRALRFDVKALERFIEQHTIDAID